MENAEFVNLPSRRVKPGQQFPAEGNGNTTVKMFSMENVSEHLFYRKKQIAREFGEEGDGDNCDRNAFRNQLAILESDPEVASEPNSKEMEHWMRKLHIRKNCVIAQTTSTSTNRTISHVAKSASRLKENPCSNNSGKVHLHAQSYQSTATAEKTVTSIGENNAEDNHTKTVAARSRGATKQTTEHRERTKRNKTSRNCSEHPTNAKPTTSDIGPSVRLS